MAFVNRVILIGNLTRDPKLEYLQSGTPVCEFSLAINRRWKDKQGNQNEDVCFVDCRAYGQAGEIIQRYMTKGRQLFVEGRLKQDTWEREGQRRSKLTVVVETFQFLGDRGEGGGGNGGERQGGYNNNRRGNYGNGGGGGYQQRDNYNQRDSYSGSRGPQVESADPVNDDFASYDDDNDHRPSMPDEDNVPF